MNGFLLHCFNTKSIKFLIKDLKPLQEKNYYIDIQQIQPQDCIAEKKNSKHIYYAKIEKVKTKKIN